MGTVSSFNWDGLNSNQYMKNQRYSICFKREPSDCRLEMMRSRNAPPYSTSIGRASGAQQGGAQTGVNPNYKNDNCGPDNGKQVKKSC